VLPGGDPIGQYRGRLTQNSDGPVGKETRFFPDSVVQSVVSNGTDSAEGMAVSYSTHGVLIT
jgi:hypothetical protein